ncbi:MAG: helix-turn-helix transcriptional regulator [Christensenellaceae bacterium]|nr:helix-turn-helix transcriptional regulator [Christensenellaceae bacterium]
MIKSTDNLKAVLDYYGIAQNELAQALDIDPSLVSRWLSGARKLRAASPQMNALAEYILAHSKRVHDMEWLKAQFEAASLPTDLSSVYRTKQNLIMWLASDGENLRRNLGGSPPGTAAKSLAPKKLQTIARSGDNAVKLGCLDMALELESILSGLSPKSTVNIFLSSDQITTTVNEDIAALLLRIIKKNDLKTRLVVCVSGDTQAMSALIDTYMGALVSGHIQLSVVHGLTQTVTNQMHLIIPGTAAMLVTETPGLIAPPVAVIIREPSFIVEIQKSFEQAARYAQPVLNIYGDDFSRNILEILYREFCTPGALDVVKDNINPMYMTEDAYNRVLLAQGHNEEEYAWRSGEFTRFKSGMNETLRGGSVFREILSLARLNQIAQDGFCRMPGLYFMNKGFVLLDAQGCIEVLNGYVRYLETVPNFHLLILDDIATLHSDNCWQLKQNHHLAINHWSGAEPVMIHSDQLILLREFQAHFDRLWAQGAGGIGNRSGVISVIQDVVKRLAERHI